MVLLVGAHHKVKGCLTGLCSVVNGSLTGLCSLVNGSLTGLPPTRLSWLQPTRPGLRSPGCPQLSLKVQGDRKIFLFLKFHHSSSIRGLIFTFDLRENSMGSTIIKDALSQHTSPPLKIGERILISASLDANHFCSEIPTIQATRRPLSQRSCRSRPMRLTSPSSPLPSGRVTVEPAKQVSL